MIYIVMYLVIALIFGKLLWKYNSKLPYFYSSRKKEEAMVMGYLWPAFSLFAILIGVHYLLLKVVNRWY